MDSGKETFFRVNEPHVIHQLFDQELVAVHLTTGTYHSLPGLAGEVFLAVGGAGASVSDIAAELAARYDAPVDTIERDVEAFLRQLETHTIMVQIAGAPSRPAADAIAARAPYVAPRLESFTDLQELFLLDPVHDVAAAGWPNVAVDPLANMELHPNQFPVIRCTIGGADVIFERFAAESVVLNLASGAYHSLSGAAEDVFLLLPEAPTTVEIRDALATKYAVELPELETALLEYLDQLSRAKLIVREPLADTVPVRTLSLARPGTNVKFAPPRLETFAQPEFNSSASAAPTSGTDKELLHGRYTLRPRDLVYAVVEGETVVCDRERGQYFRLNQPASDVFGMFATASDAAEIEVALRAKYDVHERDLRAALMILMWNLRNLGLIIPAVDDAPVAAHANTAAPRTLTPFAGFDVVVYRDLIELMQPFNRAPEVKPHPNLAHVRQFVGFMDDFFSDAANVHGLVERQYSIAGKPITVRSAGSGQPLGLQKALQHLTCTPADDQRTGGLTIHVWNYESATPRPLLGAILRRLHESWTTVCGPRGEFLDLHVGPFVAVYHPGPDVLSLVDHERGQAYYMLRNDHPLPFWEFSAPFRHIFHSWFGSAGVQFTHAAAIGVASADGNSAGVLLAGKGGSGKSTTSLLCAEAGMMYAADDYCLIDAEERYAYSLYNTAKLKGADDLDRVPAMRGRSFNADSFEAGGQAKGTFDVSGLWPERMVSGFPLRAILLPVVTHERDSRLEPCSAVEALLALAPSTVAQLPAADGIDVERLAALAKRVPSYRLHLGSDLAQIPPLVNSLLG